LDFKPENKELPEKGRLLISDPFMGDNYFSRCVILLCEHNEEGSFGFILNKFVEMDLTEMLEDISEINNRVSLGGPVENNQLYFLHTIGDQLPGSVHVAKNLYVGGDFQILRSMLASGSLDQNAVRFFVGYSGWAENQLMEELTTESWYVSDIGDLDLMDTSRDDLWGQAFRAMGGSFVALANFPADPSLN
jgi:putative transcriptional regulator